MEMIGSYQAKTQLSRLLERVNQGEEIIITRKGKPIAKLVPMGKPSMVEVQNAIDEIRRLRKGITLGNMKIKELIEEGRNY